MSLYQPFLQEVVDAHAAIEQWLSGQARLAQLPALLKRFSSRFSMITPFGARLDYAGVEAFFSQGHGARPGLRIQIDDLHGIAAWPGGAVVGYREIQTADSGQRTVRHSSAIFERDAEGGVLWRHLHETGVAQ